MERVFVFVFTMPAVRPEAVHWQAWPLFAAVPWPIAMKIIRRPSNLSEVTLIILRYNYWLRGSEAARFNFKHPAVRPVKPA